MNEAPTPRRGDRVFFQRGCDAGEEFGTILGEVLSEPRWSQWLVRLSDFSTTQILRPRASVIESADGIIAGGAGLGAYLIEPHDYSCLCFHCCPTAHTR